MEKDIQAQTPLAVKFKGGEELTSCVCVPAKLTDIMHIPAPAKLSVWLAADVAALEQQRHLELERRYSVNRRRQVELNGRAEAANTTRAPMAVDVETRELWRPGARSLVN